MQLCISYIYTQSPDSDCFALLGLIKRGSDPNIFLLVVLTMKQKSQPLLELHIFSIIEDEIGVFLCGEARYVKLFSFTL